MDKRFPALFVLAAGAMTAWPSAEALPQSVQLAQVAIGRQVGVAAGVTGPVQLVAAAAGARAAGRIVNSGEPIRIGDQIATGPDGRLQIMLLDETIFTIGPNASLTIDEFVFDSRSGSGRLSANVAKGAFRFVTGRIAANNPQDMTIKMPVGTMGIRGTVVGGWVSDDRARIVLLGPGSQNNAAERMGRVFVTGNGQQGGGVELRRPSFATDIVGRDGRPSAPFRLPAAEIEALINELSNPLTRSANRLRDGENDGDDAALAEIAPAAGGSGAAGASLTLLSGQHIVDFLRPLICPNCNVVLAVLPAPTTGVGAGDPGSGGTGGNGPGDPVVFGPRPSMPEIQTFRGSLAFPTATFSLVPNGAGTTGGRYDVSANIDLDRRSVTGQLTVVVGSATDTYSFSGSIGPLPGSTIATALSLRSTSGPSFAAVAGTTMPLSTSVAPGTTDVPLLGSGLRQSSSGSVDFRFMLEKSPGTGVVDRLSNGLAVVPVTPTPATAAPIAVGAGIAKTNGTPVPLSTTDRDKLLTDLGIRR